MSSADSFLTEISVEANARQNRAPTARQFSSFGDDHAAKLIKQFSVPGYGLRPGQRILPKVQSEPLDFR